MPTKEEADRIMSLPGEARGSSFITDALYVRSRGGDEAMRQIQAETERLGHPIDYDSITGMTWHPLGLRVLSLVVIRDFFDLDDAGLTEMADYAPKRSFIMRMLIRYFVSLKAFAGQFESGWEKHYTVGTLRAEALDERACTMTIRLRDFQMHEVQCPYLAGFIRSTVGFLLPDKRITVVEQKCMFRGDDYHEYRVTWGD